MEHNAFARYHPAVCFLYFLAVIGFTAFILHPMYLLSGFLGAVCCCLLLKGRKAGRFLAAMLPLAVLLAAINPLFNTEGSHILFRIFGRPYTLEALCYGGVLAGMFLVMMLWFSCYSTVITGDKFICLLGAAAPALSLLLVMVLRMIPSLARKAGQISQARNAIGMGVSPRDPMGRKLHHGMLVLSTLTDWALEGSVVTADSMAARGYGSGRYTSFRIYPWKRRDSILLAALLLLGGSVICAGGVHAEFTPGFSLSPLTWGYAAYCVLMAIPTVIEIKEALTWRILRSKI